MLEGRDLSHWDGSNPNLQGLSFAILKAGQGLGPRPDAYAGHLAQVRARKLIEGSYHFLTRDPGDMQAKTFITHVDQRADVRLYAVDVEIIDNAGTHPDYQHLKDFHEEFHRLMPRRFLIVYSYQSFWEGPLGNPVHSCPWCVLWTSYLHPNWPAPYGGFTSVTLHQYQTTPVDRDHFDGSWADLAELGSAKSMPAPIPKPKPVPRGATPLLSLHMVGQKVADVQHALDLLGNTTAHIDGIGYFGAETLRVLRVFQSHRGLKVTGTTTPETWAALRLVAHPVKGK